MSTPSPALGNRTPEQLKVTELREELKKRGIQIKGLKKDLVDRLEEVLKQEELEQQKELEAVVEEDAPAESIDQPEPVTPVTKKRSDGHGHRAAEAAEAAEAPEVAVSEPVLASEGTDVTVSVAPAGGEEPQVPDEDAVSGVAEDVSLVTEPAAEAAVAAVVEEVPVVEPVKIVGESAAPALEDLVADLEQNFNHIVHEEVPVEQAAAEETAVVEGQAPAEPAADVVAAVDEPVAEDIVVTEEVISTTVEQTVTTTVEEQEISVVPEDQSVAIVEEEKIVTLSTRVETVEESADEVATMEETTTTVVTVETTTAVVEEGDVKLGAEPVATLEGKGDAIVETAAAVAEEGGAKLDAEPVATLEGKGDAIVETDAAVVEEGGAKLDAEPVATVEGKGDAIVETAAAVVDEGGVKLDAEPATILEGKGDATVETAAAVVDEDGVKLDTEPATILEGKSDVTMEESPKEDDVKVADGVAAVDIPKDEMVVDVDAGTEKASTVEESKEETPMDVDADTQKGSKRKDAVDGELSALEPTKRRRWNSAKGEEDSKSAVKDIQPLELHEPVPSSNAPVPSAKVLTPKSAPPEKVAVTRTAPTRTEATVNGESQKSRVVPPSAKPATTSLKIDKFLRPFTFKAVKELLAQTGTVEDVWMDQIKTHCYVTYSSLEEATATRNALFNLQWPPQGGRLLTAEFVDPSEVKLRSDGEKAAAAAGPTATPAPPTNAITPRGALAANSKASKDGNTVPPSGQPSTAAAGLLPPPPPLTFSPRDRPKQEVERTPTLDDLFRKTRSKPHIYYLPLTAQEVADKVAARNRQAATKPGVKA